MSHVTSNVARALYRRFIKPHVKAPIRQQRLRLLWLCWGYSGILTITRLDLSSRLRTIVRFLRIDWGVRHAHWPAEITSIGRSVAALSDLGDGTVMLEAGCWNGASTAKFSILCALFGYQLRVYDSFEGVRMTEAERVGNHDFTGEYAAAEADVRAVVARYGEPDVCSYHAGWFSETLCGPVPAKVGVAYLDCDTASGTEEALQGILPSLAPAGVVYSQDFQIQPVRQLLEGDALWHRLGVVKPNLVLVQPKLVRIEWTSASGGLP